MKSHLLPVLTPFFLIITSQYCVKIILPRSEGLTLGLVQQSISDNKIFSKEILICPKGGCGWSTNVPSDVTKTFKCNILALNYSLSKIIHRLSC